MMKPWIVGAALTCAVSSAQAQQEADALPPPPPAAEQQEEASWCEQLEAEWEAHREREANRPPRRSWGAVSLGVPLQLSNPERVVAPAPSRATFDRFEPWLGNSVRGVDLRWRRFSGSAEEGHDPSQWYLRTGFTQGTAAFAEQVGGDTSRLEFITVPLFVGFSHYAFGDFPLQPYGGFGAGLDFLRLQKQAPGSAASNDFSARVGFEFHAGVRLAITDYVRLWAEAMYLWSVDREVKDMPDFSNDGLTLTSGVTVPFPLGPAP